MSKFIDRTGQRYGRLTAIERAETPLMTTRTGAWWICKCDCGEETIVSGDRLTSGQTRSCGCLRSETASKMAKKRWEKCRYR